MKYVSLLSFALLVLLGAGCNRATRIATTNQAATPSNEVAKNETPADDLRYTTMEVRMESGRFLPASLTIRAGDTVRFVNADTANHQPISSPHPDHSAYPAFAAAAPVKPEDTFTFTFDKVGTWKFHDELHPNIQGQITVFSFDEAKP